MMPLTMAEMGQEMSIKRSTVGTRPRNFWRVWGL